LNDLETDINKENREESGDFMTRMKKLYRILYSFLGGMVFFLGILFITTYLFSTTRPNDALTLGLIFIAVGALFTYFFAYKPK